MRTVLPLLSAVLAVATFATSAGTTIHPIDEIRDRVENHLVDQTRDLPITPEIEVGRLDSRLRLARCSVPLAAFITGGRPAAGNVTVGVRCEGAKRWTVYVTAKVRVFAEVTVAARSLSRGVRLAGADLAIERRDVSKLANGYVSDPVSAVGMQLRRAITRGTVLTTRVLQPPTVVRRGERVTLVAEVGNVQVRSRAEALSDGAVGQVIRLRNLTSRRVVEGEVLADGSIRVRL